MMKTLIAHFFTTINCNMALKALNFLLNPFKWGSLRNGESVKKLEDELFNYVMKEQKAKNNKQRMCHCEESELVEDDESSLFSETQTAIQYVELSKTNDKIDINGNKGKSQKLGFNLQDGTNNKLKSGKMERLNGGFPLSILRSKTAKDESREGYNILSFYNGRSAIFHGIKLLGIGEGDEIILQAFTCISVPNSIIQAGAKPIYCDIDENNLNIDPNKIESLITPKTKAILVQHTFGIPCDIYRIQEICKKYNLYLIEDCAHALGAEIDGIKCGNFGDIAIFSLGRDKVISCVNAGFLLVNNEKICHSGSYCDPNLGFGKSQNYPESSNKIGLEPKNLGIDHRSAPAINSELKNLPLSLTIKNLVYIIISFLAYKTYDFFGLGKFIIFISRKLSLIPEVLSCDEKMCKDRNFNYKLPNCLAEIGLSEFKKIDEYNEHRRKIAKVYEKEIDRFGLEKINKFKIFNLKFKNNLKDADYGFQITSIFLRYPYFTNKKQELIEYLKKNKILLGNWYSYIIDPEGTDLASCGYKKGSCPIAEKMSSEIVNLPNHHGISNKDAERIIRLILEFK